MILHITTADAWEQAGKAGEYRPPSLLTQGFIHCSLAGQVVAVADALFRGQSGLVLLCIDPARVKAEIRYEGYGQPYPHIYGPLDTGAVTQVLAFEPGQDGCFRLPAGIPVPADH
ncbi:MAG: DUF952 domain-containing protein [bacterium]|nr:DUF952 domain-containing protein [bacterium]